MERTKDDGDVKVMSAQSVRDLIEIDVCINSRSNEVYWERRTNDRTDAKIGMNVKSAIKPDFAILEYCPLSNVNHNK